MMKHALKILQEEESPFTLKEAVAEANRCEQCDDAVCEKGCPLGVSIKSFIKALQQEDVDKACEIVYEKNYFPKTCGSACNVHQDCEKSCKLENPIKIGKLERFAAEHGNAANAVENSKKEKTSKSLPKPKKINAKKSGKKIAIVGCGPSGLTCAIELQNKGHQVTIFEAQNHKGGRLASKTPQYQLPSAVYESEIANYNLNVQHGVVIGKTYNLEELQKKHDAIYLAIGASTPQILPLAGIEKGNVFSAHDFLLRINQMQAHQFPDYHTPLKKGKNVIVMGGNQIAVDTARLLKKLGSDVTVVFEHDFNQMTASPESLSKAQNENVQFVLLTQAQSIKGELDVQSLECVQMMSHITEDGTAVLSPMEGSEFELACDQVYLATGSYPTTFSDTSVHLRKTRMGKLIVNKHLQTSHEGIFAGGEVCNGPSTLATTMADGRKAAEKIDKWLNNSLEDETDEDEDALF